MRLPSEEELRAMVTPEQVCCWACMLAAEQRLKVTHLCSVFAFTVPCRMPGMEGSHCLLRKMKKMMGNLMMRYALSQQYTTISILSAECLWGDQHCNFIY